MFGQKSGVDESAESQIYIDNHVLSVMREFAGQEHQLIIKAEQFVRTYTYGPHTVRLQYRSHQATCEFGEVINYCDVAFEDFMQSSALYRRLIDGGRYLIQPTLQDMAKVDTGILVNYLDANYVYNMLLPGQEITNRLTARIFVSLEVGIGEIVSQYMENNYQYIIRDHCLDSEKYMDQDYLKEVARRLRLASEEVKMKFDKGELVEKSLIELHPVQPKQGYDSFSSAMSSYICQVNSIAN